MSKRTVVSVKPASSVRSLRDFLEFLASQGQCIPWPDAVMPEPDIRKVMVAASGDMMGGPAILFDRIRGYPGKRAVLGVHGSFANIAAVMGHPKGTSIKTLFYDLVNRWRSQSANLPRIKPEHAPVNEVRIEKDIDLFDLLPLYRINEYEGGFYIAKANVVSRDPKDPDNFGKQNVGVYRIQPHGPDVFTLMNSPVSSKVFRRWPYEVSSLSCRRHLHLQGRKRKRTVGLDYVLL